tara:strand:- start:1767 stop:1970 length:204 start_codon:yes stop_codon:yes gene_type:complete
MDPTNDLSNDLSNVYKQVSVFTNKFIVGKSICNPNEKNKILKEKYILNFIKEFNSSLNYINKFEIDL